MIMSFNPHMMRKQPVAITTHIAMHMSDVYVTGVPITNSFVPTENVKGSSLLWVKFRRGLGLTVWSSRFSRAS